MLQTKFKYENKQRAITKKLSESYGSCALHFPLMRSIHPQNFITIASISFGGILRTKIKYENKQRAITQKLSKQEFTVHVHCTPP